MAVEDVLQSIRVSASRGAVEVTGFAAAPTSPRPPLLKVDAVALGKAPPPLGSPRPDRGWTGDGHNFILAPDLFNRRDCRRLGSEVSGGFLVNNVGVVRDPSRGPAPFAEPSPQIGPGVGEIDAPQLREPAVDGAENPTAPEVGRDPRAPKLVDDLQPALGEAAGQRYPAFRLGHRPPVRAVVSLRGPLGQK